MYNVGIFLFYFPWPLAGLWFLLMALQYIYVVVQFYPWFKFDFPLFLGMVTYENEFKTKGNKI